MSISEGSGVLGPGWRRRQAWRGLMWLLVAPICIAGAFALQPTYLRLDVPVVANPVGYFWWETQRSELAYADSGGVLYVCRQVGNAYPHLQGWHTVEDAFAYFDAWLTAHGWQASGAAANSPTLPESRLLAPANLRVYHRDGRASELARLAIWPHGGSLDGFHVVLVTERPSWLKQLHGGLD
jgi:hypothetical protein